MSVRSGERGLGGVETNGVPEISGPVALLHSAAGEEEKKEKKSRRRDRVADLTSPLYLIKAGWKAAGCDCVIWWLTNACCSL